MIVEVKNGDVHGAIRKLNRTLIKDGIFQELRARREHPAKADRVKAKRRKAQARRRKIERRRIQAQAKRKRG